MPIKSKADKEAPNTQDYIFQTGFKAVTQAEIGKIQNTTKNQILPERKYSQKEDVENNPKSGLKPVLPANWDPADMLGRTDLHYENCMDFGCILFWMLAFEFSALSAHLFWHF